MLSLSARRAWIEIKLELENAELKKVALRKESVDRNAQLHHYGQADKAVALRKESVDRNKVGFGANVAIPTGRSPQGERG